MPGTEPVTQDKHYKHAQTAVACAEDQETSAATPDGRACDSLQPAIACAEDQKLSAAKLEGIGSTAGWTQTLYAHCGFSMHRLRPVARRTTGHSTQILISTLLELDHNLACSAFPWPTEQQQAELLSQVTLPEVHGRMPEDLDGTSGNSETHRCGVDEPHANIAALCVLGHLARYQACASFRLGSRHLN